MSSYEASLKRAYAARARFEAAPQEARIQELEQGVAATTTAVQALAAEVKALAARKPAPPPVPPPPPPPKVERPRPTEKHIPLIPAKAPYVNIGGRFNVRDYGAIGYDGAAHATEDTLGFQRAAARCTNRACTIIVPPTMTNQAGTGYNLTAAYLDSLGGDGTGCFTELHALVNTDVTQNVPPGHTVEGRGYLDANDQYRGGGFRSTGSFPDDGSPIVRLGVTDVACHGALLKNLFILQGDAADTQVVGVYSNSVQEMGGLKRVRIQGTNSGAVFDQVGTTANRPNNYIVEDCEFYTRAGSTGYGLLAHNGMGPTRIVRCTAGSVNGAIGNVGFSIRGSHVTLLDCHSEGMNYHLEIGGDGGSQLFNMLVDNFTGYNAGGQTAASALVRIRGTETYDWNVELRRLGMNQINSCPAIIVDERNDLQLDLATVTHQYVGYYRYWGDSTSLSSVPLVPETTGTTSAYP